MKLPEDFVMHMRGDSYTVSATLMTQQDAEAVANAILIMGSVLPSHRKAIAADFGIVEPAPPTLHDRLVEAGLVEPTQQAVLP